MIEYITFLIGIALLYKGADWLVEGASSTAKKFGVSSLVIGLTIVAFGTSTPELIANIVASLQGKSDIPFGNILGSNIFNIMVILGLSATIRPLIVNESTVWKEIPFAFLAAVVLLIMSYKSFFSTSENILTAVDGTILLLFFIIFLYYIFELMKKSLKFSNREKIKHSTMKLFLLISGGLITLVIGGKLTINSSVTIARDLGLSEFLIASTIIAAGTSLPELITSIVAAVRGKVDLAIGNIVGSNIFNIFLIMGIISIVSPLEVPKGILLDFLVMITATLLLFFFMFSGKRHKIDRWEGIVFLLLYTVYLIFIIGRG
jgi:cation:H+ antiporter